MTDLAPTRERCVNGHLYADLGVYVRKVYAGPRKGQERIECRACVQERARRYYQNVGNLKERERRRQLREEERAERRERDRVRIAAKRKADAEKKAAEAAQLAAELEPVRFPYEHPESGTPASVLFQDVPRCVFRIAAKPQHRWSQDPVMIGWLYSMWKFYVPAIPRGELFELREALDGLLDERGRRLAA